MNWKRIASLIRLNVTGQDYEGTTFWGIRWHIWQWPLTMTWDSHNNAPWRRYPGGYDPDDDIPF